MYTIDFETFYSSDVTLSKMLTDEYVLHPEFQIHCVAVKQVEGPAVVMSASEFEQWALDPARQHDAKVIIGHNLRFDGFILTKLFGWDKYDIIWIDTLGLARACIGPSLKSYSLSNVGEYLGLGGKHGQHFPILARTKGKRTEQIISEGLMPEMHAYAKRDAELTERIFLHCLTRFPEVEVPVLSWTINSYVNGKLKLNVAVLYALEQAELKRQETLLAKYAGDRSRFMSNDKFAEALTELGVDPPMKLSPKTGKPAYAFAKTDQDFITLLDHSAQEVRELVATRLGLKTTIELTRIRRLMGIAERNDGTLGVPLLYAGAHTGRFSGTGGINLQNLPRDSGMNEALEAPDGYHIVNVDLAQIEARLAFALAGQMDLVHRMHAGEDMYATYASKVYGRSIAKDTDPVERQLGKQVVLSSNYGIGADKLFRKLRLEIPDLDITIEQVKHMLYVYRNNFFRSSIWRWLDGALYQMVIQQAFPVMPSAPFITGGCDYIRMPSGLDLTYTNLHFSHDTFYFKRRGVSCPIWGGTLLENLCQALARTILTERMRELMQTYSIVLQVHDSLVLLVPDAGLSTHVKSIHRIVTAPLPWWPEFPVGASIGWGRNYKEAKKEKSL